ncbi:DNA replication complex GINS protein PSF3 [Trichophyton rubrum]|uniref:DNA replication complex GINS protein PSF3 n=1 Tax=Trichophyton rubrum TaxID=5551 RepID=A0A178F932_TRIRU|nr:DNA replication complex GINS protein PSF3 [Trichophyton rubrum]
MSYYDVDAILTDSQKVPCTFELDVPKLGFLDGNAGGDGLSPLVTLDLPKALSEQVMNALKADPRTVDLRALAPHFYRLGCRILQLFEEEEMVDVLSHTFKTRAMQISDHAHNPAGPMSGQEFLRGLDETERQLFRAAHESIKSMRAWTGEAKKK